MPALTASLTLLPPRRDRSAPRRRTGAAGGARPAAQLRHVTVTTRDRERQQVVLDDVTFAIDRGAVTAVLSRHDTSARAVMHLLAGRTEAEWGSVRVADEEITRLSATEVVRMRSRHIARVWPGFGVQPRLTIRQSLVVALRQVGRRPDFARIDLVATLLGLRGKLGYRSVTDTDSRRVRWAFARSLVGTPTLVLADDVTVGLDREEEQRLLTDLRKAARRLDVAIVLATRDAVTASEADRVVLLQRGRVVEDTAAA